MATLTGGSGNDSLTGGFGPDTLLGNAGDDRLIGGGGADLLDGGPGNDTGDYSAASGSVNVNLATGAGLGSDAANDVLTGIENLIGSAFKDTLVGDAGHNSLSGGAGADRILGGDGDDTLAGGAGADTLTGGTGMDWIDYSASGQAVSVNLSTWTALYGDAQGDVLNGVDGIIGTTFDDTLIGFNQRGVLASDIYTNIFMGGAGNDYMDGAGGSDVLYGGADQDTVLGGWGDDQLFGGEGRDNLFGGDGNDVLTGDGGADALTGGVGSDTFHGGAGDTIDGSEDGRETDVLDLRGNWPFRIVRDPGNPENGHVDLLDRYGNITGTLTFSNIERIVSCFTPGTLIATPTGPRAIDTLKAGDLVLTRDSGAQTLRWIGQRHLTTADLRADPTLQPVMIRAGALGGGLPERDMAVSRQHRMLLNGPRAELLFGADEVLVRAHHLTCLPGVTHAQCSEVTYLHMLFDRHEVVLANGAWSESFQPGERSLNGLDAAEREELFKLFPTLKTTAQPFQSARVTLKAFEVKVLLAA